MKSKSLKVNIGLNYCHSTNRYILKSTSVLGLYLEMYRFMAARKYRLVERKVIQKSCIILD